MIATIVIQFQPHMFKIGQASFWLSVTSEGWLNLATLSQGKQLTDPSQIISWKRLDHHFLLNSTAGTYCGSFRFRRLSSNIIGINRFYNILHTHIYIYTYTYIYMIPSSAREVPPPEWDGSPGSTPHSLLFASYWQHFWGPASYLLGPAFIYTYIYIHTYIYIYKYI